MTQSSRSPSARPWAVLKFGGTSVKSIERWRTIASIVDSHLEAGRRPLVVCSALGGLSDQLEGMLEDAHHGRDVGERLAAVRAMHRELATAMELDVDEVLGDLLGELERLMRGAVMLREASPRTRARVMSLGELMSTTLGAAWLSRSGRSASWQDARQLLAAEENRAAATAPALHYLSATCSHEPDVELREQLDSLSEDVVLTQGFIASDAHGDTVLLGRGGSDTSAAYFAARIGAERLEIWTDVPGMFTANPRDVPTARLLKHIGYKEAQELALMGAKVLHPRCIAPVAARAIPLHIKCTPKPDMMSTVISADAPSGVPQVKAVSARKGMVLVSIAIDRAQRVGFLAQTASIFARWNLSIDMVSASETTTTFAIDPKANALEEGVLEALIAELRELCDLRVIAPGAAVSLVGHNIHSILHELGPILERFEDHGVYMVSQAADDLNLTFIVTEDAADRLVLDLHAALFPPDIPDPTFGPTWEALSEKSPEAQVVHGWWVHRRDAVLEQAAQASPCFIYSTKAVDQALEEIRRLPVDGLLYSVKANPNVEVLDHLHAAGLGFQCGSAGELRQVAERYSGLSGRLSFAPHAAAEEDWRNALELGAHPVVGSVHALERWPNLFRGREISLRFDPGRGAPGQPFVRSAGTQFKFGISPSDAVRARRAAEAAGARVTGLHAHAGSGIRSTQTWRDIGLLLARLTEGFPEVRILNVGGGLAIRERVGGAEVDTAEVAKGLEELKRAHPQFELWMEPGRFLTARAGVLLGTVLEVEAKDGRTFVTLDAGMNDLVRTSLYGAWHELVNLSRWGEPMKITADVVGPLSDSADIIAHQRPLPRTQPGDVLLVANAGAYARSMALHYNGTAPAREIILPD